MVSTLATLFSIFCATVRKFCIAFSLKLPDLMIELRSMVGNSMLVKLESTNSPGITVRITISSSFSEQFIVISRAFFEASEPS